MRKNVFGRQFKRDTNERKALFKGLMSFLVLQERIQTTEEKAKAIKPSVEKLITLAKRHGQNSTTFLHKYLTPPAIKKLIGDVAPRFNKRNGGYTRIIRAGNRFSDNAPVALIEWVEKAQTSDVVIQKSDTKKLSASNNSASSVVSTSDVAVARKTSKGQTKSNKKTATAETQKKLKRRIKKETK